MNWIARPDNHHTRREGKAGKEIKKGIHVFCFLEIPFLESLLSKFAIPFTVPPTPNL
jgi:hypothetical protein